MCICKGINISSIKLYQAKTLYYRTEFNRHRGNRKKYWRTFCNALHRKAKRTTPGATLKFCQHNENQMRADALARSMMNNDMTEFWKDVKKNSNSNVSLVTNVDGSVGNTEIAEMWKCHYKSLLNSVQNKEFKKSVLLDINQQHESSITITPFNILDALKSIKCGKSSGVDGISAEHFVFAHSRIHVLLSLLFSAFITHGYLPNMFMKTAIVPIIKNKTGDTSDKNNYRPNYVSQLF